MSVKQRQWLYYGCLISCTYRPPSIYKYSLLYTFFFSFLLPHKSWRCSNTLPQSPLRDLLVDVAIWTALDKETGKREDKKDRRASSIYQSSNVNGYIIAT